ncbi:hypothetical protein HYZ99_03145 [Candidatus Peregrinibacteria bacterium]|nr:hypothetical protein [Candidatus Peregrinibacteria bacterium]
MLFASTVLGLLLGFSSPISLLNAVPETRWQPEAGDVLLIDTKENVGYLVHRDGVFTTFRLATGQRRVVSYIGRTYDATTPEKSWVAQSPVEFKGDRITFGAEGRFLRLWDDGERTPYGIHPHLYNERMLAKDDRFESMGCIIVSDAMMQVIEDTFALNGNHLEVVTSFGLEGLRKSLALQ